MIILNGIIAALVRDIYCVYQVEANVITKTIFELYAEAKLQIFQAIEANLDF